jgi:hypothetical protein
VGHTSLRYVITSPNENQALFLRNYYKLFTSLDTFCIEMKPHKVYNVFDYTSAKDEQQESR